jgi:hypothetical protein
MAAAVVSMSAAGAQERTSHLLVAVSGADGKPVTDLGPADFRVRIGGRDQAVVDVRPAAGIPISVAVVIDAGKSDVLPIQTALRAMVDQLAQAGPDNRVGVVGLRTPAITFLGAGAGEAFNRMFTDWLGFAYETLPGIVEAAKALQHEDARRIVLVIRDHAGLRSNDPTTANTAASALYEANAALWTVFVKASDDPTGGVVGAPDAAVIDLPALSGGLSSPVFVPKAIETATQHVIDLILAQYVVTYAPKDVPARSQLRVEVRRPKAAVIAPTWVR